MPAHAGEHAEAGREVLESVRMPCVLQLAYSVVPLGPLACESAHTTVFLFLCALPAIGAQLHVK